VETSSANNRTIAAILSAPGIAAVYISVFSLLNEGLLVLVPFYFVFAYVFSLVPGAIAILLMRKMRFTKLWQFAICGLIVSAICTAVFVVYAYSTNEPSFEFYAQESSELIELVIIGPLAGATTWVIMESKLLSTSLVWLSSFVVLTGVFGLYQYSVPDLDIHPELSLDFMEERYSEQALSVLGLVEVSDPDQLEREKERLHEWFAQDAALRSVSFGGTGESWSFFHSNGRAASGRSCGGALRNDNGRLQRCERVYEGRFDREETITHVRHFTVNETSYAVEMEFNYEELLIHKRKDDMTR
jgi:hypothetical protein